MARPRLASVSIATPERLLAGAEGEFARVGYDRARLEDIARRAGIRRSSLLYHYPTKEALYAAVVERSFSRLAAALSEAMGAEAPFPRRLARVVASFTRFLGESPQVAPIVVRELLADDSPGRRILLERVAPVIGAVEAFIRREGRGRLRSGVPVRGALMQVCADALLRAGAGSLREPLWGPGDDAVRLASALLLDDTAREAS